MAEHVVELPDCPVYTGDTIQITKTLWNSERVNNQLAVVKSAKLELTLNQSYKTISARWIIKAVTSKYNEEIDVYSGQFQRIKRANT